MTAEIFRTILHAHRTSGHILTVQLLGQNNIQVVLGFIPVV